VREIKGDARGNRRTLRTALARTFVTAAVAGLASPAAAQREVTLEDALQLARQQSRELRVASARLERSASTIDEARAALMPQVTTRGRYAHNNREVTLDVGAELGRTVLGLADAIRAGGGNPSLNASIDDYSRRLSATAGAPIVIQKSTQLDADFRVVIPLFAPHARDTVSAAERTHAAHAAERDTTESDVLLAVAQAFYAAAAADELVVARRNAITVATQTVATAKARVQQGTATNLETLRAQVALDRTHQAAVEAEDVCARAYRTLATLLDTRESLHAVAPETIDPLTEPAETLIEAAMRQRPELTFYQRSLDATAASFRASSTSRAPTISAFGDAQTFNYAGFSGEKYFWAAGLQLDWQLFDGGIRAARRRQALADRREYEARLALTRDTIADEVSNAWRIVGTKRRALETAVRARELSRETLRVVRLQYAAGTALQLDLLSAQDSLVSAEVATAQARFDLALADLQLRHDTGLPASATASVASRTPSQVAMR
jgi:outer membrane protein TolC